ncbi:MAG: alpha/beta hydrolase fold domain-containing protein, partial [Clostridia bacterium]|nr:alpha/beta hydrolase fold domain-containing protein [Clostridia bacterium]
MILSVKNVKAHMETLSPLLKSSSLRTMRIGQNMIGDIIKARNKNDVIIRKHEFEKFTGAWVIPKDERRDGVIIYLHGGGYTCGGLDYSLGFGSAAAVESGTKVFCCAYRLAPENRYPAALEDALEAYEYVISKGYPPQRITLAG